MWLLTFVHEATKYGGRERATPRIVTIQPCQGGRENRDEGTGHCAKEKLPALKTEENSTK
jgi:hypothetical protein